MRTSPRCTRTRARCGWSTGPTKCTCARSPSTSCRKRALSRVDPLDALELSLRRGAAELHVVRHADAVPESDEVVHDLRRLRGAPAQRARPRAGRSGRASASRTSTSPRCTPARSAARARPPKRSRRSRSSRCSRSRGVTRDPDRPDRRLDDAARPARVAGDGRDARRLVGRHPGDGAVGDRARAHARKRSTRSPRAIRASASRSCRTRARSTPRSARSRRAITTSCSRSRTHR